MKSLQKKQEFLIHKVLPIFNIKPNYKHIIDINQSHIDQLNSLLPEIKKIFVMREFNLHKMGDQITTVKQARQFLFKLLKQANLEFESEKNALRLLWNDSALYNMIENTEIRTLSIGEFEDVRIVTQFVRCKGKSFVHFPNFICNSEYTLLSAQIKETINNLQYELQMGGTKVKEGLVSANTELLLSTIFPYNIDIYQSLTIVLFSSDLATVSLQLTIGKLKPLIRKQLETGEHTFTDDKHNLKLRLVQGKVKVGHIQVLDTVVNSPVVQYVIEKTETLNEKKIVHIISSKYNQFPSLTASDFIVALVQTKANIVLGFTNINFDGMLSPYKTELFDMFEKDGTIYAVHTINRSTDIIRRINCSHSFKLYCCNTEMEYNPNSCLNVVYPYFVFQLVIELKNSIDVNSLFDNEHISIEFESGIFDTELRKKVSHYNEPLITLDKIVHI